MTLKTLLQAIIIGSICCYGAFKMGQDNKAPREISVQLLRTSSGMTTTYTLLLTTGTHEGLHVFNLSYHQINNFAGRSTNGAPLLNSNYK